MDGIVLTDIIAFPQMVLQFCDETYEFNVSEPSIGSSPGSQWRLTCFSETPLSLIFGDANSKGPRVPGGDLVIALPMS